MKLASLGLDGKAVEQFTAFQTSCASLVDPKQMKDITGALRKRGAAGEESKKQVDGLQAVGEEERNGGAELQVGLQAIAQVLETKPPYGARRREACAK